MMRKNSKPCNGDMVRVDNGVPKFSAPSALKKQNHPAPERDWVTENARGEVYFTRVGESRCWKDQSSESHARIR